MELLFDDLPLPAWVFDERTLAFLDVNDAAVTAYGWSREAFLAMSLYDIRPEEDVAALRAHVSAARPAADRGERWRHLTRDGRLLHVRVHSHAIAFRGRAARLAIIEDITSEVAQAQRERNALRAARDSEARFRAVVESIGDGVLITDLDDLVLHVNPEFERMLGWTAGEMEGRRASDFLVGDAERPALLERNAERATGRSAVIEEALRHRDGSIRTIETRATPLRSSSGEVVGTVGAMTDVTRRKDAERAIAELNERLARQADAYRQLASFGAEIERIHDVAALVDLGLRRLTEILGMDVAAFYDVEDRTVVTARTFGPLDGPLGEEVRRPRPFGEGVIGWVAASGRYDFAEDYAASPNALPAMVALGLRSQLSLPVRAGRDVGHVLSVASLRSAVRLSQDDLSIAQAFVHRLENALERVRVLEDVRATRQATFRAFGIALEHRSYETKGHTDRVVALTTRLGRSVGLDDEALQALQWGAYLHDIGKIAISDAILLKPARLTAEEYEAVKAHALIGHRMLADQAFLPREARDVVRHHHERWDGTGYPDGLRGAAIPLGARLFAFADVFDALTSDRPYKEVWPVERAVDEIRAGAGSHFDPELVEPFVALVEPVAST